MLTSFTQGTEIVVVGAGPYGLSVAAHLRAQGLPFRIFGKRMHTWATQMPEGMCLRSGVESSSLSAPGAGLTLSDFLAANGKSPDASSPVPLADFIAYGEAFAQRFVPDLAEEHVRSIDRQGDTFRVITATGERLLSKRVVIATGFTYLQKIPREYRHLPATRLTHPSQHSSYHAFRGHDVVVLGSGGSAFDAAVLLHEAGARVVLIAQVTRARLEKRLRTSPRRHMNETWGPSHPDLYRHLPTSVRRLLNISGEIGRDITRKTSRRRPCADVGLQARLRDVPMLLGARIHAIEPADGACERLRITLTDRGGHVQQHLTSHVICATGYQYDKDRLPMLAQSLREQIRVGREGAPKLSGGFESSVPGLHFVGPLAAPSFGPLLCSISGSSFAAQRVTRNIQKGLERERERGRRTVGVGVLPSRQRT